MLNKVMVSHKFPPAFSLATGNLSGVLSPPFSLSLAYEQAHDIMDPGQTLDL